MPYCFVPSCRSGNPKYTKQLKADGKEIPRFFTAQNQELLQIWNTKIKRGDRPLTMSDRVCSNHFLANDVDLFFETRLPDGTIDRIRRGRAKLKDGAVPCLFEECPSYNKTVPKKRKAPMVREVKSAEKGETNKSTIETAIPEIHLHADANKSHSTDPPLSDEPEEDTNQNADESVLNESSPTFDQAPDNDNRWSSSKVALLELPAGWVVCNTPQTHGKVLAHINEDIKIDKSIKFQVQADVEIKINGINYEGELPFEIDSVENAQKLLNYINQLRTCCGTEKNSKPSSIYCSGATKSQSQMRCDACSNERARIRKRAARLEEVQARAQEKKKQISSRLKHLERSKSRLMLKVQALKARIGEAMLRYRTAKKDSLEQAISQLPNAQQESVKACFEAANNKGPNGRRYTMEWTNKCLLMRIKSPKLYDHIRSHNILPLPAHSTLTSYTRNMGGASSLQPLGLEIDKKKIADMDEVERGTIMVDEIELTPEITIDKANLSV